MKCLCGTGVTTAEKVGVNNHQVRIVGGNTNQVAPGWNKIYFPHQTELLFTEMTQYVFSIACVFDLFQEFNNTAAEINGRLS